jgi:hypothetical protein
MRESSRMQSDRVDIDRWLQMRKPKRHGCRGNMKRGIQDKVATEIRVSERCVFDRYNIIDEADLRGAGERLEEYAKQRRRERAARLRRVK